MGKISCCFHFDVDKHPHYQENWTFKISPLFQYSVWVWIGGTKVNTFETLAENYLFETEMANNNLQFETIERTLRCNCFSNYGESPHFICYGIIYILIYISSIAYTVENWYQLNAENTKAFTLESNNIILVANI